MGKTNTQMKRERHMMMTKKEWKIIEDFVYGFSVDELTYQYEVPSVGVEDILRKALKAQDKKKGKA
jgi:hypothetical protein